MKCVIKNKIELVLPFKTIKQPVKLSDCHAFINISIGKLTLVNPCSYGNFRAASFRHIDWMYYLSGTSLKTDSNIIKVLHFYV